MMYLFALLDMSAAFDCVDHELLVKKLHCCFGMSDTVAAWFESYLFNLIQQILFNNKLSAVEHVPFGAPQGSVLGQFLFLMYTTDVFKINEKFDLKYHDFAADIQIIGHIPAILFSNLIDK